MGAMAWDSHIPPRGPVDPCCPASTRNPPALLGSSPPGSQTPWASALGDRRSSGHLSPPKAATSRASSPSPLLKDPEACETTGLTSTTFPGPRDRPAWVRMPRGRLGLWRSVTPRFPGLASPPAPRSHSRHLAWLKGTRSREAQRPLDTGDAHPKPRASCRGTAGVPASRSQAKASGASLQGQTRPLTSPACPRTENRASEAR